MSIITMFKNLFSSKDNAPRKVTIPEKNAGFIPITAEEINLDEKKNLETISREFREAFDFIKKFPRSVSIFGSSRIPPNDAHYKQASEVAFRIAKELNYAIITGGGPGIMEAANEGAWKAGGKSLGLSIRLRHEQLTNQFVEEHVTFNYFFTRKTALSFAGEAYIFFPGGFGTLDELFDILTLVQTTKIPRVPIILVGSDFWKPLDEFIKKIMKENHKTVSADDMSLYTITDSEDEIIEMVKKAPFQEWWKNFELI